MSGKLTFDTIVYSARRITLPRKYRVGSLVRITIQELKVIPVDENNITVDYNQLMK